MLKDFSRDEILELSHFILLLLWLKMDLAENVQQCSFSNSESSVIPWRRSRFGDRQTSLYSCPITRCVQAWLWQGTNTPELFCLKISKTF